MTEPHGNVRRGGGLRGIGPRAGGPPGAGLRRSVEPLSPQAWQRVESAVFARLDAAAVPWSLSPEPLHSHAGPSLDRSLRLHWAASVGLALASAVAAASVLHLTRPAPRIEAGPPAELVMPVLPQSTPEVEPARPAQPASAVLPHAAAAEQALDRAPAAPAIPAPQLARPAPRREAPERTAPGSDRERLFARAAGLESANAPLALALYLSLASGDDDWAANALYAAARLEIDRGLHEAGSDHLVEYLARFPHGENVADVRSLRQPSGIHRR